MTVEALESPELKTTKHFVGIVKDKTEAESYVRVSSDEEVKSVPWRLLVRSLLPADTVRFKILRVSVKDEGFNDYLIHTIEFLRGETVVYWIHDIDEELLQEHISEDEPIETDYGQVDFMLSELERMAASGELVRIQDQV